MLLCLENISLKKTHNNKSDVSINKISLKLNKISGSFNKEKKINEKRRKKPFYYLNRPKKKLLVKRLQL